jgi:hypothetical protein
MPITADSRGALETVRPSVLASTPNSRPPTGRPAASTTSRNADRRDAKANLNPRLGRASAAAQAGSGSRDHRK